MKKPQDIGKQVKARLEGAHKAPDDLVWNRIEQHLDKGSTPTSGGRKRPLVFWLGLMLGGVSLVVLYLTMELDLRRTSTDFENKETTERIEKHSQPSDLNFTDTNEGQTQLTKEPDSASETKVKTDGQCSTTGRAQSNEWSVVSKSEAQVATDPSTAVTQPTALPDTFGKILHQTDHRPSATSGKVGERARDMTTRLVSDNNANARAGKAAADTQIAAANKVSTPVARDGEREDSSVNKRPVQELDSEKSSAGSGQTNAMESSTTGRATTVSATPSGKELGETEVDPQETEESPEEEEPTEIEEVPEETADDAVNITVEPVKFWGVGVYVHPLYYNPMGDRSMLGTFLDGHTTRRELSTAYGVALDLSIDGKVYLGVGLAVSKPSYALTDVPSVTPQDLGRIAQMAVLRGGGVTMAELQAFVGQNTTVNLLHDMEYKEIPLRIIYRSQHRNIGYEALAGVSTYFLSSSRVYVENQAGEVLSLGKLRDFSKGGISADIGFGGYYRFTRDLHFYATPVFKYHFIGGTSGGKGTEGVIFGLQTGVVYRFGRF